MASYFDQNIGQSILVNNTTGSSISGILAGTPGQFLVIKNASGGKMDILHEDSSSSAASRFTLGGSSNQEWDKGQSSLFVYSGSDQRWIQVTAPL